MTRKRMIKLLMSVGCDRNHATAGANLCDGSTSHAEIYHRALRWFSFVEDDFTGAVAGIVGSVYE